MIPIKIQFELSFKLYTCVYYLSQKQQKASQNLDISAIFSKKLNVMQIFKKIETFTIFSKNFTFFKTSGSFRKVSAILSTSLKSKIL